MKIKNGLTLALIIFSGLSFLISGCASVPKSENMKVENLSIQKKHPETIRIKVTGGGTSFLVSNEEFYKAIKESILNSQLFSAVIEEGESVYLLDVFLGDQKQTYIGLNMDTFMEVVWNVSDVKTGKSIWQKTVHTAYTATTEDAFVGAKRFMISTERAAQENIKKGLSLLSEAKF